MTSKAIKKMLLGEQMPDKDDPNYKEKHEKCVEAGKSFAQKVGLDKAAARVQRFASNYPKLFLSLIFGFVLFSVGLNLYRMSKAVTYRNQPSSAVQRQEKELQFRRHHAPKPSVGKKSEPNINQQIIEYEPYTRQD